MITQELREECIVNKISHFCEQLLFAMYLVPLYPLYGFCRNLWTRYPQKACEASVIVVKVNQNWNVSTKFSKIMQYKTWRKAVRRIWNCTGRQTDRQTDRQRGVNVNNFSTSVSTRQAPDSNECFQSWVRSLQKLISGIVLENTHCSDSCKTLQEVPSRGKT